MIRNYRNDEIDLHPEISPEEQKSFLVNFSFLARFGFADGKLLFPFFFRRKKKRKSQTPRYASINISLSP